MPSQFSTFLLFAFLISSCSTGKLSVIADLPSSLKETSAIEMTKNPDLLWVIEDAGNKNNLYALNTKGKIVKDINLENIQNIDWEDLTSDSQGNIYIGDFGNNAKKRKNFAIYKVINPKDASTSAKAEVISFSLPKDMESEDFESFFLYNNAFYIFSKGHKKCKLIKVPNTIGDHVAEFISEYKLKGKHRRVTSADISEDGKTVVLLTHDKLWKLTNYTLDNFFNGTIEVIKFDHDSQKEGVNFLDSNTLYITDEKTKNEGGNIYRFNLN
ncbi:SdiA-regulated domain-containing protein [uncultured Psychroserpens sp.]|uniref:SdiA-regulated domain-containing protein n=1 Tax=uncultured Psychroserpens sp. TaxID=255436 RepID=UPI0026080F10|nr:SdiA-regulated domain-containing protein [uncultured Psychroserpens sp.]